MPQVLILHASLGTGHTSAAKALGEAYARFPDVHVAVCDILDYTGDLVRAGLTAFYSQASEKAPSLYKMLYEGTEGDKVDDPFGSEKLLAILGAPLFTDLNKLIKKTAPDIIVSVHALAVQVVNRLVEHGQYVGLHYVVITDFVAHRTWMAKAVDGYFLPSDLTGELLAERGVPRAKMHTTGIPVKLEISQPKDSAAIRAAHDLATDTPLITLFEGGLQVEHVRRIVTRLLHINHPMQLVVVAGRNAEIQNALADLNGNVHVRFRNLGAIDFVDDLIAASNLIITKAGGLIVSEVLARNTPLIIIDPIPGQEEWNADFVSGSGAGIQLRMPEMVPATVEFLLRQPQRITEMGVQAHLVGHPHAALDIAEYSLDAWTELEKSAYVA